ncbi:MAG: hypothetical protein QM669_12865 [Siphonobacter sp.]
MKTMILQSLSQNIPIAVLEGLVILMIAARIGWWFGSRALSRRIDEVQMAIATKQVELKECQEGVRNPVFQKNEFLLIVPVVPMDSSDPEAIPDINAPAYLEEPDDLKIIEGIGPKIEQILNNAGIVTFVALAATPVEQLQQILTEAGPRFLVHDASSWPKQARFAAEGRWEELKTWQDELYKGRER